MIIPDNVPSSPAKSNAALSNPTSPLESPPPPAYGASDGRTIPLPPQQHYQPYIGSSSSSLPNAPQSPYNRPIELEANDTRRRRESAGRRFCKAFAVALLIYVLVAIFFGTFSLRRKTVPKGWHSDFAIPNHVVVKSCTRGSEMRNSSIGWGSPYEFTSDPLSSELSAGLSSSLPSSNKFNYGSVQTSLSLPLSSDTLFLVSRGPLFTGGLRVEPSSDLEEGIAKVDVRITYTDFAKQSKPFSLLSQTSVCLVHKRSGKGKQVGVGLFTSQNWPSSSYPRPQLTYDVTLVLPEPRGPSILRLDAFETDLPNFHHLFTRPLDEFVTFGSLILKAGNGIVNAVSLTADNATIHTSNREINLKSLTSNFASLYTMNSEIKGHFTTSQSLEIKAINSNIKANIELVPQYSNGGGSISIQTTRKALEAVINIHHPSDFFNFFSTSSESSPTHYVSTRNKDGIVDVSVPLLPLNSALNLTAYSTNGRVTASLPATYEGSYALTTTNNLGEVHNEHAEDPAGLGRERVWDSDSTRHNENRGSVYWNESDKDKGAVVLKSINGQAELFL
ncbi:hypothetical protein J3R30DRAFT_1807628 [Lentinula aciculospora]|uniref:DUF7330 domain-containing protein n=1 Tax=Lentinula aciculospora TaxID=153920 RepID=A0A9W9DS63_9AGAR|nr:hypothetical protein J3R30DRAFT_1807628 [Lentinula aciculospora]